MADLFAHAHVAAPHMHHISNRGHYPDEPGYRKTDTSKAAAASLKPSVEILRGKVLSALAFHRDMTADECAIILGVDKLSIRPRFTELKLAGLIQDTGTRRANDSGKSAIVWRRVAGN